MRSRCVVIYKGGRGGAPCIRFPPDGELLSLCRGPSPFLSLPLLLPFAFLHSSEKTNSSRRASTVFFSLHQSRHKMSVSGSRGATRQDVTSSTLSKTPEGGSLACRQCGTTVCSLKSLVSSVSLPVRFVRATRSIADIFFLFVYSSPIGDSLVCITLPIGGEPAATQWI